MLRGSFFLSLRPCRSPSDHLPRSPCCSPCNWWIKSVSVGRLGGKKRKTSERIRSANSFFFSSGNADLHTLMGVRRLIWVKLEILTFIFTLKDHHLHDRVNLDCLSIHSKNMTSEYGWLAVAKRLLIACLKSYTQWVWLENKQSRLTQLQTFCLSGMCPSTMRILWNQSCCKIDL